MTLVRYPPFGCELRCVRCGLKSWLYADTRDKLVQVLADCAWHQDGETMLCGECKS